MKKDKNAFTMSETLIVIVVLGIIAMLTLPNVYKKYLESVKRLKIKKAMKVYDFAVTKMTIENDLKSSSALQEWASKDDCNNSVSYFKTTKRSKCTFRTSDGLWWNIDDMVRPVISFNKITDDNLDSIKANARDLDNNSAFVMVTSTDNSTGAFRVDDLEYEKEHPVYNSDKLVEKLYDYINNVVRACDIFCRYKRGDFNTPCQSNVKETCSVTTTNAQGVSTTKVYDSDGNQIGTVTTNAQGITTKEVIKNDDGSTTTITYRADGTKQQETLEKYDASGKNGFRSDILYYADGKTIKSEGTQEKVNGQWGCGIKTDYYESGNLKATTEIIDSKNYSGSSDMQGTNNQHFKKTSYYENGITKQYYENIANTGDNKDKYPTTSSWYNYNTDGILTEYNKNDYAGYKIDAITSAYTWQHYGATYYENGNLKSEQTISSVTQGKTLADSMTSTVYYENGQVKSYAKEITPTSVAPNSTIYQLQSYYTTDVYNSNGKLVATVSNLPYDENLPLNYQQNKKQVITWYNSSGQVVEKDITEYAAPSITTKQVIEDGIVYTSSKTNSNIGVVVENSNPVSQTSYRITYDSNGNEIRTNGTTSVDTYLWYNLTFRSTSTSCCDFDKVPRSNVPLN